MLPNRYGPTNGNAMAGILLADALYEINERERAERLLTVYVPLARDLGLPDQIITGHTVLARIACDRGDVDGAHEWLAALEHLGHHRGLPRLVLGAMLERARLALLQGNQHAAEQALQHAADPALWRARPGLSAVSSFANDLEDVVMGRLRLALFAEPCVRTREAIETELATTERAQLMRRALKLRILLALACQRSGEAPRRCRRWAKPCALARRKASSASSLTKARTCAGWWPRPACVRAARCPRGMWSACCKPAAARRSLWTRPPCRRAMGCWNRSRPRSRKC